MNKKPYIIAFIFFLIDLISKQIITRLIDLGESVKVINNFFYITHVHNKGAAWSILEDKQILLLIITVIALYFINKFINKEKIDNKESIAYGIILGGILGNLFDRLLYHEVIDFIDFKIFGYDYPVFNLADTFIVIGVILLIIFYLRGEYLERSSSRRK